MRRVRATGTALAVLMLLAACTSSPSSDSGSSGADSSTTSSPSVPPQTGTTPTISTGGGTTPPGGPATTTPTTPTSSTPAGGEAPGKDYCAPSALAVRAISGSGGGGKQYALIMFTNNGSATCTLGGYPGVSLRAGGKQLATAARTGVTWSTVRLAPGGKAQASVVDTSTCQASLSDTVRVYPPNFTVYYESPLQLRGCALTVGPVQSA